MSARGATKLYQPRPLGNDPAHTVDYPETERYVQLSHLLPIETNTVLIRAPMGTGKSTCIGSYINTQPSDSRIIVIGPRKSFEASITSELNRKMQGGQPFQCYMGMKRAEIRDASRLVIQYESLFKVEADGSKDGAEIQSYDTVVIDECESVLTQAVAYETNKDRIKRNQAVFERLLKKAKRVFLMDAFLSDRTFRFVQALGLSYKFHHYHRKPVPRTATRFDTSYNLTEKQIRDKGFRNAQALRKHEIEAFVSELVSDLLQGRRVYFFASSREKVIQIQEMIAVAWPGEREDRPRIKEYHSGTADKADLSNIRKEWSQADLVITTCTITVGCNYDYSRDDHPEFMFDLVYMYGSACSKNLIRDMFQAHMRVRHLRMDQMKYFLDPTPLNCQALMDRKQLTEWVDRLERNGQALTQGHGGKYETTAEHWKELYIDALEEQNHSGRYFQEMFLYYLKENNYSTDVETDPYKNEEVELEALPKDPPPYDSVPELTLTQVGALKQQRMSNDPEVKRLTPLEQASIDRFYFDRSVQEDLQMERRSTLWLLYHKLGRQKYLNCRFELGQKKGLTTLADLMAEGRGHLWNRTMQLRADVINRICQEMGLKNTLELQKITNERWEQVMASPGFQKLEQDAKTAFQAEGGKKPITWLAQCISEWSGSKLGRSKKRERKRVGGKMVDVAPLELTPMDEELWKDLRPYGEVAQEVVVITEEGTATGSVGKLL